MPTYVYSCSEGHESEIHRSMTEETPATQTCYCGKRAKRDRAAEMHGNSILRATRRREFFAHYNPSFGCDIESRAHLEHLQKERGYSDAGEAEMATTPSPGWDKPKAETSLPWGS
jgi:hypothetical protein